LFLNQLLGLDPGDSIGLSLFLHLGTAVSATIYYRDDVTWILHGGTSELKDLRLKLVVITLITGAVGYPIYKGLSTHISLGESLLALTGLALLLTAGLQKISSKTYSIRVNSPGWLLALLLGFSQGLAVLPGLSRSGVTSSLLLMSGYDGERAFKYSFIMSIPASLAASMGLVLVEGFQVSTYSIVAAITAEATGVLVIGVLIDIVKRLNFWKVCLLMGLVAIGVWLPNLLYF